MGYPQLSSIYRWIFHYKPSKSSIYRWVFHYKPFILGYPHDYGNMRSSEGGSADFDSYRFSELEKRSLEMYMRVSIVMGVPQNGWVYNGKTQ